MRSFDYENLRNQTWDSEIVGLVAQIHEFKGRQEVYLKQKPATLSKLIEVAKVQSTEASNKIEGIVTTSTRIKQIFADKTSPRNRDEKEIAGYRDVLNTIHESYEWIYLQPSYILQLHRDLYKYSDITFGGNFKNVQNYIAEKSADGTEKIRFMPLAPYETPNAIAAICDSFNKAVANSSVDTLILIPVFINDFLCIHPFNDGNGRMSRLLTTLLLYRLGYVVGKYISLEVKIERTKTVYYQALEESDENWNTGNNNPASFIKYLLGVILSAYRDFEERIVLFDNNSSAYDKVKVAVKEKLGKFTKSEIMELCPSLSKSSIEGTLRQLVEEKYIIKYGGGRSTFYAKNEKF